MKINIEESKSLSEFHNRRQKIEKLGRGVGAKPTSFHITDLSKNDNGEVISVRGAVVFTDVPKDKEALLREKVSEAIRYNLI